MKPEMASRQSGSNFELNMVSRELDIEISRFVSGLLAGMPAAMLHPFIIAVIP